MRTLIILTIIFISTGCNPCKRLQRKCPPVIKDSISYVETIKFDTIILVSPADTLILRIPVEPDINDLIIEASNKPGPIVSVKIQDGIMEIVAICPEDSLKAIINSLQTELSNQTTIYQDVEVDVVRNSKLAKICMVFSLVAVLLIIFVIVYKIKVGSLKSLVSKLR